MTIKETFANWQAWRLARMKITVQTADRLDDDFKRYLESTSFSHRDPADVTREELWDFCDALFQEEKLRSHAWLNFKSLINGIFDYVFYNSRVFFLFFVVVGIAVVFAIKELAKIPLAKSPLIGTKFTTGSCFADTLARFCFISARC